MAAIVRIPSGRHESLIHIEPITVFSTMVKQKTKHIIGHADDYDDHDVQRALNKKHLDDNQTGNVQNAHGV